MKGKILNYDEGNSTGIIVGDDGQRYNFTIDKWKEDKVPKKNQLVDFEISGKSAIAIYLDSVPIVDMDEIKEKFSSIGIDRENIDSTIDSAKIGLNKAGSFLGPWIESIKEQTKQIFIHGPAYKWPFILSLIIFFILFIQQSFNSISVLGIPSMLFTYVLLAFSCILSIRLAYIRERRKTVKVMIGLFIVLSIYVILGIIFYEDFVIIGGTAGMGKLVTYSSYASGGIAMFAASIVYTMVGGELAMAILFINIVVSPIIVSLSLIGIYFLLKDKYLNSNNDTDVTLDKKHLRWISITIVLLTLVFGFIGTFFSRYIVGERPLVESLIPTAIHFALGILLVIPFIGSFLYLPGIIYIAYLNMGIVLKMVEKYKTQPAS